MRLENVRIENLEVNISFSKDDPVATFNKTQNSQDKGEEQCQPESLLIITLKLFLIE